MNIGGTLAQAREAAGLTVADVSARTRIRTPLIRAIEQGDFGQCGGDFYARGHIRAIARVVGVDSRPLIAEYDAEHPDTAPPPPESGRGVGLEDLFPPEPAPPEPAPPEPAPPEPAPPEPAPQGPEEARGPRHAYAPEPAHVPEHAQAREPRRIPASLVLLAAAALAVIGGGVYQLASASGPGHAATTSAAGRHSRAPARSPSPTAPSTSASPTTSPSPSPSPSHSPVQVVTELKPSSATAIGPNGGDNPGNASKALAGNAGDPWHTDWYTTAAFGNLQSGTGLMLTLPRTATVTGVTVKFGDSGGAMQVKAGTSPDSLRTVASSGSAGGTTRLSFGKTSARYIELWFTRLGTDSSGYQVAVYDVSVSALASRAS